jgi:hypothetical protein
LTPPALAPAEGRVGPPLIVLLCLMIAGGTFSIGAFPALLPEIGVTAGLADWALGILAGAFGFARMIANIPVGRTLRRLPSSPVKVNSPSSSYSIRRWRMSTPRSASMANTRSAMPEPAAEPNKRARSSPASEGESDLSAGPATSSKSARASAMLAAVMRLCPRACHSWKKVSDNSCRKRPRSSGDREISSSSASGTCSTFAT